MLVRPKTFLCLLCWLVIVSLTLRAEDVAKIIAKVNNQAITSKDLEDYAQAIQYHVADLESEISPAEPGFRRQALQRLIEDKLILDQAKKEKIFIPLAMVDDRLNQLIASHPSRTAFEESLIQRGFTVTQLKEKIKEQYLMREVIQMKVRSYVSVLPQEVSAYYAENEDQMYAPLTYVFYIATAEEQKQLQDMAAVIKVEGLDGALRDYPKDFIRVESSKDELKPEIAAVASRLKKTEIEITKIDKLYYLIYLDEAIEPKLLSLSQAQDKIYAYLWDKKFKEKFSEWIKALKEKSVIKIYEPE